MENILDIVDENDQVVGQASRQEIHRQGLLHREIHVYFVTPNREVIFQHRAKDKETFPDLLDATVGGHVEVGDSYGETAVKETEEETGVKVDEQDLVVARKDQNLSEDPITKTANHTLRISYFYLYKGKIENLKIEAGEGIGFEAWPMDKLLNLTDQEKSKFIPQALSFVIGDLVNYI